MTIEFRSWFDNGQLRHSPDFLENNLARIRGLMLGRTWYWTGFADAPQPGYLREDFVEFTNPAFPIFSSLYYRDST